MATTSSSSELSRGLLLGAAWLAWFVAGYGYVLANGPVKVFLENMSPQQQIGLGAWTLGSTVLLFFAILLTVRGLVARRRLPPA